MHRDILINDGKFLIYLYTLPLRLDGNLMMSGDTSYIIDSGIWGELHSKFYGGGDRRKDGVSIIFSCKIVVDPLIRIHRSGFKAL